MISVRIRNLRQIDGFTPAEVDGDMLVGEDFYSEVALLLGEDPATSNIGRIALQIGDLRVKVEEGRNLRDYLTEEAIVPDLIPLIKLKIAADGLGFFLAINSEFFDPCDTVGRIREEIKLRDNFTFDMYIGDELFDDDTTPICKYSPKIFRKDSSTVVIRRPRPPPNFPQSRRVLSPSAETWKPKVQQPHPFPGASYKSFDPQVIASSYFLGISGVVPRPIALTSTVSETGQRNCAPFSYFNIIAHDPVSTPLAPISFLFIYFLNSSLPLSLSANSCYRNMSKCERDKERYLTKHRSYETVCCQHNQ
jgi:hypothetical protein